MPEYIEREKVHRLVRSLTQYAWTNPNKSKYRVTVDIDDVQFGIDKIPAADVAEVRHGRKITHKRHRGFYSIECPICEGKFPSNKPYTEEIEYCSECGKRLDDTFRNFCPNCGAKMDVGNNNA